MRLSGNFVNNFFARSNQTHVKRRCVHIAHIDAR